MGLKAIARMLNEEKRKTPAQMQMALLGYGTAMTGMVLKNNYITAGGFITGIGCVAALFLLKTVDATAFFVVASIVSLILPGLMMNCKK